MNDVFFLNTFQNSFYKYIFNNIRLNSMELTYSIHFLIIPQKMTHENTGIKLS